MDASIWNMAWLLLFMSVCASVSFIDCIYDAQTQTEVIIFPLKRAFLVFAATDSAITKHIHMPTQTQTTITNSQNSVCCRTENIDKSVTEMKWTVESQHILPMCLLHWYIYINIFRMKWCCFHNAANTYYL